MELSDIPPILEAAARSREQDPLAFSTQLLFGARSVAVTGANGTQHRVVFVPGHYDKSNAYGPDGRRCPLMVIGKCPWIGDMGRRRLFSGETGAVWKKIFWAANVSTDDVYLTNAVRFVPPQSGKALRAEWVSTCRWLLQAEIELVKPERILVFGADAAKALLGRDTKLTLLTGNDAVDYAGIPVFAAMHPVAVLKEPTRLRAFSLDIARVIRSATGRDVPPASVKYDYIYDAAHLLRVLDDLRLRGCTEYGLDAEWGGIDGSGWQNGGSLRTIQFSPEPHEAYNVVLRSQGMLPLFTPDIESAYALLREHLSNPDIRIYGHSIRDDNKFLASEANIRCMRQILNGADTMLMHHLLHPGDQHGLETLSAHFTDCGRYDVALEKWLTENKYSKDKLNERGYGDVPDNILLPYGAYDADVPRRVAQVLIDGLKDRRVAHPYAVDGMQIETQYDMYRQVVHPVIPVLDEMERVGMYVDKPRLLGLIDLFDEKAVQLSNAFVDKIGWPDFNFRSVDHVREFLFGTQAKGQLRPATATCLHLHPLISTEKPSRDWDKIPDDAKQQGLVSPSTNAETLQILAAEAPLAYELKRLRTVDQVIKGFLCPPDEDGESTEEVEFSRGLASFIDEDGAIRTRIGQLTNSGRYTSRSPNLMNQYKKQETELRLMFATDEKRLRDRAKWQAADPAELKAEGLLHPGYHTVRSCFTAPPGWVLVSADYRQAELNVLAHLAGDETMIAILADPDRDLHAEMAVTAFNLDCKPKDVKSIYPKYRNMAKAVIFGIAYGRGAGAIVRQIKGEGIVMRVEEAQTLIDAFFAKFPRVHDYVVACKRAVHTVGYVETPCGRRRYFVPTQDNGVNAAQEREAVNHPIQGTVADALYMALYNLGRYRAIHGLRYFMVLPVHDAVMLYAHPEDARIVAETVIPTCMTEEAMVPHLGLKLRTDVDLTLRWDDTLTADEAIQAALRERERMKRVGEKDKLERWISEYSRSFGGWASERGRDAERIRNAPNLSGVGV